MGIFIPLMNRAREKKKSPSALKKREEKVNESAERRKERVDQSKRSTKPIEQFHYTRFPTLRVYTIDDALHIRNTITARG